MLFPPRLASIKLLYSCCDKYLASFVHDHYIIKHWNSVFVQNSNMWAKLLSLLKFWLKSFWALSKNMDNSILNKKVTIASSLLLVVHVDFIITVWAFLMGLCHLSSPVLWNQTIELVVGLFCFQFLLCKYVFNCMLILQFLKPAVPCY